jgi:hypothetical protein
MKRTALALLAKTALIGSSERWEGFVYQNKNDLTIHRNIGTSPSLVECRAEALNALLDLGSTQAGDFECWLNCRSDSRLRDIKSASELSGVFLAGRRQQSV